MREFDDADEVMEFCNEIWRDDIDPIVLDEVAMSDYELGDFDLGEEDAMEDEGFLVEFFQGHSSVYDVFGELRTHFRAGFPLFRVIAGAHPRTNVSTLQKLATDENTEVLWAVAGNPSAGDGLLKQLAQSQTFLPSGIEALADPWLDDESPIGLRFGAGDPWELNDTPIAASIAGNHSCGQELLDLFAQTDDLDLAKALLHRNADRLSLAQWRRLYDGTVNRSREDGGWMQWMAVSDFLPEQLYAQILDDSVEGRILARRLVTAPSTSLATLQLVLKSQPDAWTQMRCQQHPQADAEIRR